MSQEQPLVSCLMVTQNRAQLARRAIKCFADQTWNNRELVIVDDGDENYSEILESYRNQYAIHYHRVERNEQRNLGSLRNLSLELASGDWCAQWDDDEWYHEERLAAQMRSAEHQDLDGVLLRSTLMHLDTPEYVRHPYRAELRSGTPGTILHKRTTVRYPDLRKREDSVFRDRLARTIRLGIVEQPHSHLVIRCFHGANTWDERHFRRRLRRTFVDRLDFLRAKYIRGDLFTHPRFHLTAKEREAVDRFFQDSLELGIFSA